jgi:hypothetical protein
VGARARLCIGAALSDQGCNHGPTLRSTSPQFSLDDQNGPPNRKEKHRMANILVNIEKGIEIGAEDALKWLTGANKALKAAPQVIAALATLIVAVEKPIAELAGAASNPLNIALDIQTATDLKAVWPDVKAFLCSLGVKF